MAKKNPPVIKSNEKIEPIAKKSNPEFAIRIFLAVLVLILYGQSINFEFTLDDEIFNDVKASKYEVYLN